MGRVSAVYWPGTGGLATALAEFADQPHKWPGIEEPGDHPVVLILADTRQRFDSLTRGRLPHWGAAAAFPSRNTIVLLASGDPRQVLPHELAHLALRNTVRSVPLWFDEGYAARAAREWSRLEGLRVNWALVTGRIPSLAAVTHDLRSNRGKAESAYALATTAVIFLERLGGSRGLQPLISNLRHGRDFDLVLRKTNGISLNQFETMWQHDLKKRYGWLLFFTSFGVFWTLVLLVFGTSWYVRKRRDRKRRAALDEGWVVSPAGGEQS